MRSLPALGSRLLLVSHRLWAGPSGIAATAEGRAGGRSGLRARCAGHRTGRFFWCWILGNNVFDSLLRLADNYNHATDDPTTEAQSARRTHRDFFSREIRCSPPAWRSLLATGSCAGQPQGHALGRSCPGCCLWPPPVGPAWAAMSSGRGGLPDKRSCKGGQEAGRA
jgi:hypothetical protein